MPGRKEDCLYLSHGGVRRTLTGEGEGERSGSVIRGPRSRGGAVRSARE